MTSIHQHASCRPLFSVIIPAFNEQRLIADALKSIRRQSIKSVEIIVVANGCTDSTADVAAELADLVMTTDVQGISNAKNSGAHAARGRILVFMDADCQMASNVLVDISTAVWSGATGGKLRLRPLDADGIRANGSLWIDHFRSLLRIDSPILVDGAGAAMYATQELFLAIASHYGEGFDTRRRVLVDVDFIRKLKRHGRYRYLPSTVVYTSMRRFLEEGYVKCWLEDLWHTFDSDATRARWQRPN